MSSLFLEYLANFFFNRKNTCRFAVLGSKIFGQFLDDFFECFQCIKIREGGGYWKNIGFAGC